MHIMTCLTSAKELRNTINKKDKLHLHPPHLTGKPFSLFISSEQSCMFGVISLPD